MRYFIVFFAFLSGCASVKTRHDSELFELAVLVENKLAERVLPGEKHVWESTAVSVKDMNVIFKDLPESVIGQCSIPGIQDINEPMSIYVDPYYWKYADDSGKEMLILHEIVHCKGQQSAHGGNSDDSVPSTIMTEISFSSKVFEKHKEYYYDEAYDRIYGVLEKIYETRQRLLRPPGGG